MEAAGQAPSDTAVVATTEMTPEGAAVTAPLTADSAEVSDWQFPAPAEPVPLAAQVAAAPVASAPAASAPAGSPLASALAAAVPASGPTSARVPEAAPPAPAPGPVGPDAELARRLAAWENRITVPDSGYARLHHLHVQGGGHWR